MAANHVADADDNAVNNNDLAIDGDGDVQYSLYSPFNPDYVLQRIRYRHEVHESGSGRGRDIHGSPIRLSSVSIRVDESRRCCCMEWMLICGLICVVWLLMALPTVFYIRTYVLATDSSDNRTPTNNNSTNNTMCTPVKYAGNECAPSLSHLQNCLADSNSQNNSDIYISDSINQSKVESTVKLISTVQDLVPEECKVKLTPFLCLYFFNLCGEKTNRVTKPSMEQCMQLRDNACNDIWELVKNIQQFSHLIPQCDSLPPKNSSMTMDIYSCNSSQSHHPNKGVHENATCKQLCKDHFFCDGSVCRPECNVWSPYSDTTVKVTDALIILCIVFALIAGCIVLVLACIRRSRVCVFPTILIVYQTVSTLVLAVTVTVGYISRSKLFCTSRDLIYTVSHPTPFCILSGIVLYYVMAQLLLLWVFQVAFVFWGTWWPLYARRFLLSGKGHILHALMLTLGLLLPIIPVAAVGTQGGFTLTRLPAILCAGSHVNANFFSMILPISIVVACGATLLILIMRVVIKKHVIAALRGQRPRFSWWSSEIKVLIVLCYYIILGVVVLTTFTIAMTDLKTFYHEIMKYFACERQPQFGNNTNSTNSSTCDLERVERLINPIPTTFSFILIGIYPAVNLVYAWNLKELREKWKSRQVQYVNRNETNNRFPREAIRATIRHPHSFNGATK